MIALVMSVSLPMTTYAANWYLEDGSVTVNADNSGQTVTQGRRSMAGAMESFRSRRDR